jgi:hypothetical protein
MVMNLAHEMLHGRGLDDFVNERRAHMAKNKIRAANNQNELNEQHIHDYEIFELDIRAFDIQIGWRDAFERQREGHHLLIPWSPSSWSVVDPKKYSAYKVFYI